MKISKLKKLKELILAEPAAYNQSTWYTQRAIFLNSESCGTVACLGDTACLMEGYKMDGVEDNNTVKHPKTGKKIEIMEAAQKILGLTKHEANCLFVGDASLWSDKAREAYQAAPGHCDPLEARARAAAMELDRLIRKEQRRARAKK